MLGADAAQGEDLAALALPGDLALVLLAAFDLDQLGHEVAHLADLLLGFFLAGGLDGVLDLGAGGVHGFELVGRHGFSLV